MSIEKNKAKAAQDSAKEGVRVGSPDKTREPKPKRIEEKEEKSTRVGSPDKTRQVTPKYPTK